MIRTIQLRTVLCVAICAFAATFVAVATAAQADVTITNGRLDLNAFAEAQTRNSDFVDHEDPGLLINPVSGPFDVHPTAAPPDADAGEDGSAHAESSAHLDATLAIDAQSMHLTYHDTQSVAASGHRGGPQSDVFAEGGGDFLLQIDFKVTAPVPFRITGSDSHGRCGTGIQVSGPNSVIFTGGSTSGTLDPGDYAVFVSEGACATVDLHTGPADQSSADMASGDLDLTVGEPVERDPTATSLACPGDSSHTQSAGVSGVAITCIVSVDDTCATPCAPSTPTGSVTIDFADGTADSGCTLAASAAVGRATCQVSVKPDSPGIHAVSATYAGDGQHDASNDRETFTTTGDHYQVELKAWIPQDHVVDPNIPHQVPYPLLAAPGLLEAVTPPRTPCFLFPEGLELPQIFVSSQFKGDAHAAYDGSFRVRPVADFDLEKGKITNFKVSDPADSFGVTSLDYTFRAGGLFGFHQCSQQAQQVAAEGGQQLSDTSFELSISADDPLVEPRGPGPDSPFVPNIDSTLLGSFDSQGNLTLTATHDLFPSHGLRVIHNGVPIETKVTNDVSCLAPGTVEGFLGMGLLAYSLGQSQQDQPFTVSPNQTDTTTVPAPSCSSTFFTIDFFSLGEKSLFSAPDASEASAGSRLLVAPQRGAHAGQFLSLEAAVNAGLITSYDAGGGHLVLGVNPAQPVVLKTEGAAAITSTEITDGKPKTSQQFGPLSGNIEFRLTGKSVNVTRNGKQARPHTVDRRPPRTTAKITTHGKTATVTITAHDASGIKFTIVTAGRKRIRLHHNRFTISTRKLRTVRVFSVDTFDNTETPHRLRR